ncbi:4Fe-4S dicluster domain-containing protein [Prolixibacteraceae bacterium Z1-6]|uniref:4Fe-4S dicluster domain-containing protein n=1 Tax=Draconibacterium aestuarii TaxID=2998507 RepID=A0A9X3J5N1_9BACT|nr:4Fe-4S dicluster domain-containing protein [Prolixibacteraceae bacterium Z1-6]
MSIEHDIEYQLRKQGANFIRFVNISFLTKEQNKNYSGAILFGVVLLPEYIRKVRNTPSYVEKMKQTRQIQHDEFHLTELKTDQMADDLATFLHKKGYDACSQSEATIEAGGFYDKHHNRTPLPHKTIAGLAGLGWIGKHNLLVTPEFGSAVSMCSVLTNAPLKTVSEQPLKSLCGTCQECVAICPTKALSGNSWNAETSRDNLLDYKRCTTCLECMIYCPWTQKYAQRNYSRLP